MVCPASSPALTVLLLAALAWAPGAGGCAGAGDGGKPAGGSDGGGTGGDGAFTADDPFALRAYCLAVADAACTLARSCDNGLLFNRYADPDRCRAAAWTACTQEALPAERAVAAGAAGYSSRAVQACLVAVQAAGCASGVTTWGLDRCLEQSSDPSACSRYLLRDSPLEECRAIFQGRVAADQPCYHALECVTGSGCVQGSSGLDCPGSCQPAKGIAASCVPGTRECAAGLDCAGSPARCVPRGVQGESCTTTGEGAPFSRCLPPLSCLIARYQTYGTCQPPDGLDQACGDERARCQPDLHCRRKTAGAPEGGCSRAIGRGEDCDVGLSEPPGPCALGDLCYGPALRNGQPYAGGTCEPIPEDGEPCARYLDGCLDGYCAFNGEQDRTGVCQPLKEVGLGCGANAMCGSGVCETTCQATPAPACLRPAAP